MKSITFQKPGRHGTDLLLTPLPLERAYQEQAKTGRLVRNIAIPFSTLITGGLDEVNDYFADRLVEGGYASDMSYTPIGVEGDRIIVTVSAIVDNDSCGND